MTHTYTDQLRNRFASLLPEAKKASRASEDLAITFAIAMADYKLWCKTHSRVDLCLAVNGLHEIVGS